MTYTTNILALPLVLIVWVVDAYLLCLLAYGITRKLSGERAGQLGICLEQFVEPVPQAVGRWLERHAAKPVKQWVPWAAVIALGLAVRHLIVWITASM